jgi:hypothetical protein
MKKARFIKIGENGKALAPSAKAWVAVADTQQMLEWAVVPVKVDDWESATEARIAKELKTSKLAGKTGWRIPTVEELFLLADRTRKERPAIDVKFFPDCPSDWFWTSTPYAPSPGDCAWGVLFNDGGALWDDRFNSGFVRAVRARQS